MYLHIGNDFIVNENEIVGVFDLDTATISKKTRDFLKLAEKNGEVETVSYELPKSFIVCRDKDGKQKIYISQLAPTTLEKRVADGKAIFVSEV